MLRLGPAQYVFYMGRDFFLRVLSRLLLSHRFAGAEAAVLPVAGRHSPPARSFKDKWS